MIKDLPKRLRDPFERFWAAYPKRFQPLRRRAEDAFVRAVERGADPQFLIDAAGRFAAELKAQGTSSQYYPLASTWLGQERYVDYALARDGDVVVDRSVSQDPTAEALVNAGIEPNAVAAWFGGCQLMPDHTVSPPGLVIEAKSRFIADTIRQRFEKQLLAGFGVARVVYKWPGGSHGGLA